MEKIDFDAAPTKVLINDPYGPGLMKEMEKKGKARSSEWKNGRRIMMIYEKRVFPQYFAEILSHRCFHVVYWILTKYGHDAILTFSQCIPL